MRTVMDDLKGDPLNGIHICQPIEGDLHNTAILRVKHRTQIILPQLGKHLSGRR